jgi:hypothetical protein
MSKELDSVETMLAHFLCADALPQKRNELWDIGAKLHFDELKPAKMFALSAADRYITEDADVMLHTPQDLIGRHVEVANLYANRVEWFAFRKLNKRPRGVVVGAPNADLYEMHLKCLFSSGESEYLHRVAAINKRGRPVAVLYEGNKWQGDPFADGKKLVMAASIVEDCYRPKCFEASVQDVVQIVFPVEQGHHLEVFKLRDGPYTGSRRKPLLHWVAKHLRRTRKPDAPAEVKEHLRGVHKFDIDGLHVELSADTSPLHH